MLRHVLQDSLGIFAHRIEHAPQAGQACEAFADMLELRLFVVGRMVKNVVQEMTRRQVDNPLQIAAIYPLHQLETAGPIFHISQIQSVHGIVGGCVKGRQKAASAQLQMPFD